MKSRRVLLTGALFIAAALATLGSPGWAAAGGGCRGVPVSDTRGTTVAMDESCFGPTILRVEVGNAVTWTNKSLQPHTVTGANASWGDYSELKAGDSAEQRFDTPGVYPYYCFLHPGMVGAVVVGDGANGEGTSGGAVQAARPGTDSGRGADDSRGSATTDSRQRDTWPLWLGGALGVVGLTAGAGVATFAVSRRK